MESSLDILDLSKLCPTIQYLGSRTAPYIHYTMNINYVFVLHKFGEVTFPAHVNMQCMVGYTVIGMSRILLQHKSNVETLLYRHFIIYLYKYSIHF